MQILVNDQPREVQPQTSVADLLQQLEVTTKGVAVELNRELVPREQHAQRVLAEGDRLEVVTLVGGG